MIDFLIIIFFSLSVFITRIINLLKIPIFTDEAIYIRWAQIGFSDPAHRYISLTDGKQPLFIWLMYPMLKIFNDPLFAGRFVSVLSGVFSVIGIYFVSRELFGRKTAIFSSFLFLVSPFAIVYDRLALMDSLLAAFCIWSIYLEVLLIRKIRLDVSLLLGISVGLGMLTKSSALFCLILLPVSLILRNDIKKSLVRWFSKWMLFSIISVVISEVIYNSLRLSPWFYMIKQKNYSFIMTIPEFLNSGLRDFFPHLNGLLTFLTGYITIPILSIIIAGILYAIYKRENRIIFLFFWFLVPFLALTAFGKVLFPRFILFMVMPLFIISGYTLSLISSYLRHKNKILYVILPLILFYPIFLTVQLIFSPKDTAIPVNDRNQLFNDWPSGYGIKEVIEYIDNESKNGKVVIGTEGTFGLNPASMEIYLGKNRNVEIYGFWPVSEVPKKLIELSYLYPTYLIFKESQKIPPDWPLTLINKYRRGNGNTYLLFYRVDPEKISK
jgi:hypothetical protein